MARPRVPMEERFWAKVKKQDGDQCWLWTGAINSRGYGTISLPVSGKTYAAHKYSYELLRGPIPDGLWVLHKCDVRNCVRPDHLFLGTSSDNAVDAFQKGRRHAPPPRIAENNHNSKLTRENVMQIKIMLRLHIHTEIIASQFGVHKQTIIDIRRGINWKHVVLEDENMPLWGISSVN